MITRPDGPVYLRAIDEHDLGLVHRWHNDPARYASLVGTFVPTSLATERAWLRRVSAWAGSQARRTSSATAAPRPGAAAWARARTSSPDVHPKPSRPPRR